jgi:hypothetical protein
MERQPGRKTVRKISKGEKQTQGSTKKIHREKGGRKIYRKKHEKDNGVGWLERQREIESKLEREREREKARKKQRERVIRKKDNQKYRQIQIER